MWSLFVISLFTALAAAFVYLSASGEIPRIMALIIIALCFVLDLILAPWPIQMLILMVVLFSTRNVALPNQHWWG